MIILSCRHLTKSFGIDEILRDVTFNINEGDKVGLIGPNGEGKSTLFKILTKQLDYDSGELFLDKNKTLGYLSQNLSLDSENTIYDEMLSVFSSLTELEDKIKTLEEKLNEPYDASKEEYHNKLIKDYTLSQELYENRGGYTFRGEISRVLKGLGFLEEDFNNQIINLSGGQKTRLALCKLLLRKPDLLLLDEPTNHLDLEAIEWLEEYLNGYKGTVFVISHDRFFLDSVTNTTFELIGGKIHCYNASYTKFLELRKKDIEARLKAYNLQQAEIKRQEEIIEKFRSFNREKSVRAAESRQKALDKMDRLEAPEVIKEASKISFETLVKSGNDVLHIENLKKSYDSLLFENVNLDLKRGEKVALIGENGRGKTTLFKIIMGMLKQDSGSVSLGKNVFTGYYDQEQSNLNLHKTIIDEVWDDFPNLTTTEVRNYLASFLFTGDDVFKEISLLSGGEKCKINLLKLMLSKANLLLLDEPTNHLDIMSREALEDAILSYDGTLIVISHDRYFLNKVINKIVELQENGLKTYLGNYNYYMDKKANPNRYEDIDEEINQGKTKTQIKEERKKKKSAEKSARALRAQLRDVEKLIPQKEEELEKLQGMLCTEEVYSNPEESVRVNKEINSVQEEIDSLYATWEELSESLEE
ncbi:MAG: ABC-F family ATP-binding cassette domain-containing protein [Clostridium perfringens]|uniref:ABC-F family ATP-binding cassette domain-containing protein n=1 Tax=Clostridium perfringens TaxID=1502 RepID=UPI000D714F83|nr:ABC-F family ATP-binding cassette domain-containing protein [Clostridium perfringens]ELC8385586.1 ABC-F family ATP-binding cassette domain-containing protein [Clostridium perfringens]ELC8406931.1 ABC-F family ATP-binding cassette domain-containing protein [Clostridium perfringens]MBO3318624.1 ABC-F family ATP-binding cassette domain-containing protein [Clostridium perfringens]MBO3361483.1 ABC-F family ATP-binding cassette domain-containing protein [Clostridium perfringens]MCX0387446.1 ABC-F